MLSCKFTVKSVQAFCYRYPLSTPVVTSFGKMTNRPAVFVRVEDEDGYIGWGEVWCNFPSPGAEHRTRLINELLAAGISGFEANHPSEVFDQLARSSAILALQSGEQGPFAQSIAGIDLAIWDLFSRRRNVALWRLLGGADNQIKVYASGINPTGSKQMAERAMEAGHRAFKLKIGFNPESDEANLSALRDLAGDGLVAADVNQNWSIDRALELAPRLERFRLAWLEEPLRADRPWAEWKRLRAEVSLPLACGENLSSHDDFKRALGDDVLSVVQPDIAKWGGLSLCADIARNIRSSGKTFCPHYLGGGIGLLASAHLLAAIGGEGLLEVDCNENPLRDELCGPIADVREGVVTLGDDPGIGIEPDLAPIERYRVN